jgi:hypothetical protein
VEVVPEGGQQRRVYLFGYEEVTGYVSFDLVASTQPSASQVALFIRSMERHLALPVRRVCTINIELPEEDILTYLKDIAVEPSSQQMVSTQLLSPLEKKAELDLLLRLTRNQNNSVARSKALAAKLAISQFVRSGHNDRKVRAWPVVDLQRRGLAAMLGPSLAIRFKLRTPSRRIVTF